MGWGDRPLIRASSGTGKVAELLKGTDTPSASEKVGSTESRCPPLSARETVSAPSRDWTGEKRGGAVAGPYFHVRYYISRLFSWIHLYQVT